MARASADGASDPGGAVAPDGATTSGGDPPALSIRGLRKSYGAAEALAGIDLEVGREGIPGIVADLVAAGRSVYGVRETGSTLEDTYLEAVGGESR